MHGATQQYLALVEEHSRKAQAAENGSERGIHLELAQIYQARLNLLNEPSRLAQLDGEPHAGSPTRA